MMLVCRSLFEIFTTLQIGGSVEVCLSTKDRRNFALARDEHGRDFQGALVRAQRARPAHHSKMLR